MELFASTNTQYTLDSLKRLALFLLLGITSNTLCADLNIVVQNKTEVPVLDGILDDWDETAFTTVLVTNTRADSALTIQAVQLAMATSGENVYAALRWPDDSYDTQHKPYVWNEEKQRYVAGPQKEDRVALQFEMAGAYDVNWLSGNEFKADTWHWKSARTDPLGLAHDKLTRVTTSPLLKSYRVLNPDGVELFIQRVSDKGEKIYKSKRYGLKEKALMQRYIVNPMVSGSIADVKAASKWSNGYWSLELRRALDTGQDDDIRFERGKRVRGGLAVFNRTGDDDHAISDNLTFIFE